MLDLCHRTSYCVGEGEVVGHKGYSPDTMSIDNIEELWVGSEPRDDVGVFLQSLLWVQGVEIALDHDGKPFVTMSIHVCEVLG